MGRAESGCRPRIASQLFKEIVLDLDGHRQRLSLVRAQFPSFREMNEGVGTIRIEAVAICASGPGQHVLFYQNNHRNDISVYLVKIGLHRHSLKTSGKIKRHMTFQPFHLPWIRNCMLSHSIKSRGKFRSCTQNHSIAGFSDLVTKPLVDLPAFLHRIVKYLQENSN